MTRAIWYVLKVAILIGIVIWLAERPGTVSINWLGYVVETSFGIALLAGIAVLILAVMLYRLVRSLIGLPTGLSSRSRARRRERGYEALTQGMVAVAAGDAETARKMARKADGLLNEPPLTMLLSAQAAQLQGDEAAARQYFTQMLERPETAFLGLRGLLTQALKSGDRVEALQLARRAHDLQPNTPWLLNTLYDLDARAGNWSAADASLTRAVQIGAVPKGEGQRHRATLLLERSFEAERQGRSDTALEHARTAHDLMPNFVPATVRVARLLSLNNQPKKAAKAVERNWLMSPHPELAEIYRLVLSSYEPMARLKLFEKLARQTPDSIEADLAMANAALEARLWGEARSHLNHALARHPTQRVYHLLAKLERDEHGDEAAAQSWLIKAVTAAPDAAWTCQACGTINSGWGGLCGHCGAFDSLEWKAPVTMVAVAANGGPTSLPALVEGLNADGVDGTVPKIAKSTS